MRTRLTILLTVLSAAGLAAPAAHAKPAVGFADQKPSMFTDPRFTGMGIHQARINLPWDVLQDPTTLANVDAWMKGARMDGVTPLITIDRSRLPGLQSKNPTASGLATQVKLWRVRWRGQVQNISAWNEGNINKKPQLVASWYRSILKVCKGCTVLGADLVDRSNAGSWAKKFIKAAKRQPKAWGLHNYIDANNFKTTNTRAFLKAVKGDVWLTETGGVLSRKSGGSARFKGTGPAHAAKATSFLLKTITKVNKRIKRVYLYSWSTAPNDLSWDSGMIGPDGLERPALKIVRCYLGNCNKGFVPGPIVVPPAADNTNPTG